MIRGQFKIYLHLIGTLLAFSAIGSAAELTLLPAPKVYSSPAAALAYAKARLGAGGPDMSAVVAKLQQDANKALTQPMPSVTDKTVLPASGNPHDYFSFGPYWWPNPETEDGLPYVQRDGERNPEAIAGDTARLGIVTESTLTLGLAYYFTGNEAYAQNAIERLRIWFLGPATRMNPNLQYAQAIPGITDGRGIGIIDTVRMIRMIDGIQLLASSPSWTPEIETGMEQWFSDYLDWLLTSSHGQDEAKAKNNHGTWYDAQVVSFALFVGRVDLAKQVATAALSKRLATQVEPDGEQPEEMRRTNSMNYSIYNARAFLSIAAGAAVASGADWWSYTAPNGASLKKVIDFLAPYWDEAVSWPREDISYPSRSDIHQLIAFAAAQSSDPAWTDLAWQLAETVAPANAQWKLYLPLPLAGLEVPLQTSDVLGESSFAAPGHWIDQRVPLSGNTYVVSGKTLRTIEGPAPQQFAGGSLILKNAGTLAYKGTANSAVITIEALIADGGRIAHYDGHRSVFTLRGGLTLQAGGVVFISGESGRDFNIQAKITGPGKLVLQGSSVETEPPPFFSLSETNSYSGGTEVQQSARLIVHNVGALGQGDVIVHDGGQLVLSVSGAIAPGAMLVLPDQSEVVQLAFDGEAKVAGLSISGVRYLEGGTYGAAGSGADFPVGVFSGTGRLRIPFSPYEEWQRVHFTPEQLADVTISSDLADPDGDGRENLLEYAFGSDPLAADAAGASPVPVLADDYLTLTYFKLRDDLTYTAEWSTDLRTWISGPDSLTEATEGSLVTARARVSLAVAPRQFMRIRVQRNAPPNH